MLKANSAECRTQSPLNEQERFKMQKLAWNEDELFSATKQQQAKMSKDDFEAIQRLGNQLYGKGCK